MNEEVSNNKNDSKLSSVEIISAVENARCPIDENCIINESFKIILKPLQII